MRYISLLSILFFAVIINAQTSMDKWYFGNEAGLDFSSGSPVAITTSALNSIEASASIADASGNLLFYTDGVTVWDATNNVTPNGTGLLGNVSTSQIMIVQKPGSVNNYYIFYADSFGGPNGLRYSEMDMSLNNGNGDIVLATKNTLLYLNASEKMAAVSHCNGTDVWLATKKNSENNFYAYLITASGIQTPVISSSGNIDGSCCHMMKFSPNGAFLAYTNNYLDTGDDSKLYNFNALTGALTFHSNLPRSAANLENTYGISFSPDNTKLYTSTFYHTSPEGVKNVLYQYDMESTDIAASRTIIFSVLYPNQGVNPTPFGNLQNGPDGKIYLARWSSNTPAFSLGVINNPNALGSACNFQLDGVSLGTKRSLIGLPSFNESNFNTSTPITCDELSVNERFKLNFKIYPNPVKDTFQLKFEKQENEITIELYSSLGKLVLKTTKFHVNEVDVNISDLNQNIYFLKVSNGKNFDTFKIVKQ